MSVQQSIQAQEIAFQGGVWRARSDGFASPPTATLLRGRETKGVAYVLTDVEGGDREASQQLRDRIVAAYYRDPSRSLTSSLLRAFRTASFGSTEGIHGRDLRSADDQPGRARRSAPRAAALVQRGADAYLARSASCYIYCVTDGEIVQLGQLGEFGPERPSREVGDGDDLAIELYHRRLKPGEVFLLTTQELPSLTEIGASTIGEALRAWERRGIATRARVLVLSVEGEATAADLDDVEAVERAVDEERKLAAASSATAFALSPPRPFPALARAEPAEATLPELQVGDRLISFLESTGTSIQKASWSASRYIGVGLAVVMLVLAGAVCVLVPWRISQDRAQSSDTLNLVVWAEQREREALAEADPAERRRILTEAAELAGKASRLRRGETSVQVIQTRIQAALDELNVVYRMPTPVRLAEVNGEVASFVWSETALYVIDSSGARAIGYPLAPDGLSVASQAVIVRAGDQLRDETIGVLNAATWVPAGSTRLTSALVLLTQSGQLLELQPGRGLARLQSPGARVGSLIAGYAGSLYVLSPVEGTLKWYMPTPAGFDRNGYDYFAPGVQVDLGDARDLAVGGDLYLLRPTGRIERYAAGRPQPFDGVAPDLPLSSPTGLALTPNRVFVADPGNRRIVEFDREGRFRRQLRATGRDDWLDDVRALAADEARRRIFVLTRTTIFSADLGASRE
ncbi:MAG: hypothetical protein HYY04_08970 [Chloroflexi bacterium]|nr:hypothetical protein [Chloroflexota bacterium]